MFWNWSHNFVEIVETASILSNHKTQQHPSRINDIAENQSSWDVLRDLVSFVQFKKREEHQWRSVTFTCNFTKRNTPSWMFSRFYIVETVPNCAKASQIIMKHVITLNNSFHANVKFLYPLKIWKNS